MHGGGVNAAAKRYGIPVESWLDLSTGINPQGWPVPRIPQSVFARLPEADDALESAAAEYYGSSDLLALAGSQQAIELLPRLRRELSGRSRVGVLAPGYAEHDYHWRVNGHQVVSVPAQAIEAHLPELDVLVVINPCNPSTCRFTPLQLEQWREALASRGGWLVVDEAFIDATPELSLLRGEMPPGLIVLRSLGKFFGLAGLRVGFLFAEQAVREALEKVIGPWSIAHPSRWVAAQALQDTRWQQRTRERLIVQQARLRGLLQTYLSDPVHSTALFAWVETDEARYLGQRLAMRAVLVRRFETPSGLRFGLPGVETQWRWLERVLQEIKE
ncbi:L-threonine 3-O-phosphate decarboxylase [Marinobacterium lacunae]|uniref:threonine-phosphate decarboxylase n=1 Tax=Marinobacterium lacunae TaxID=1232683 RepID=A0A081G2X2_9GAMM|nr:L-threonine 3-O-phosphate decarboxylase [Marinobacterium lacunae]